MFDAVRVGPETARWPMRAVRRDSVVASLIGAVSIHCANRHHRRLVAGRMNLSVNLLARAVLAVVTGGSDDEDATIDELGCGDAKRIELVRVDRRHAEAQVPHANVVGRSV